ncbi:hypothetical protein Aru02nite_60750 [Actinocatenispora rupis]|uniref:Uncharacterized protein n=1 Tax=Actinocatenispora rupis TaxID=519421 RepID=A0A8J3NDM2_9ACTN|nr:hypothetical protein Aru02nite_60750 [Actinocatenispora rupis]
MSPSSTESPAEATTFHTLATISARISSAIANLPVSSRQARTGVPAPAYPITIGPGTGGTRPRDGNHGHRPAGAARRAGSLGRQTTATRPASPASRRGGVMAKKSRKKKARKKSAANHGKRPNS